MLNGTTLCRRYCTTLPGQQRLTAATRRWPFCHKWSNSVIWSMGPVCFQLRPPSCLAFSFTLICFPHSPSPEITPAVYPLPKTTISGSAFRKPDPRKDFPGTSTPRALDLLKLLSFLSPASSLPLHSSLSVCSCSFTNLTSVLS